MKKLLASLVLVFAVAVLAFAQQPAAQKKEITNAAEYNAYMGAIQATDPNMKVQNLEGFIAQYPNSVVKEDALVALYQAYQAAGKPDKTLETIDRVLQVNPNNVTALAVGSYLHRAYAQAGQDAPTHLAKARQMGEQGLKALPNFEKPANMSDVDFAKLKDSLAGIFKGSIGIAALQANEYAIAKPDLQDAVNGLPAGDPTSFSLIYPLALAYLNDKQSTPDQMLQGIWYCARSVNLAPDAANKANISKFCGHKYARYHGGDDGWPDVIAAAAAGNTPPAGWTVKPAPTPAEQAANMCAQKTPDKMSFDEIQFILTSGNQQCSDTVWNAIKDKPLALGGAKVITVSPTEMSLAASLDDISATPPKADITLKMAAEMPAKIAPKEGASIDFQGKPVSFTPDPFMMTMEEGALVKQKGSEPPPKKPTATHHPAATHKKTQ